MGYRLAVFGTVAVLIQSISGQCIGNLNGPGRFGNSLPYSNQPGPFKPGPGLQGCAASTGGNFAVTSTSRVSPTGVSVLAENLAIEGPLAVGGNLPFLGTVGLEGTMPGRGMGSVSYGCGSGNIGIVNENGPGSYGLPGSGIAGPLSSSVGGLAPGVGPYGIPGSAGAAAGSFLSRPLGPGPASCGFNGLGPAGYGSGFGFGGLNGIRS